MRKNFIYRLTSKLLVLVMAVSLVLSVIPCFLVTANAASTITEQEVISKLKSAESKWADGERYIDRLDDNVYTCFGFGRELFRYVFGADAPLSWSLSKAKFVNGTRNVKEIGHLGQNYSLNELKALLAQAKPGDLLVASNGRSNHLVIIRSASDDGSKIYVYDANWKKDKQRRPLIRTNARWTASEIREKKPTGVTLYRYVNYVVDSNPTPTVSISNGVYTLAPKCAPTRRLDVKSASTENKANIQIYQDNGTLAQQFEFVDLGDGYYSITAKVSGLCVDVQSGKKESGTNVWQYKPNSTDAQKWKLEDAGDGYYYIVPKLNNGLCLDVYREKDENKTNVQVYRKKQNDAQKWKLIPVS